MQDPSHGGTAGAVKSNQGSRREAGELVVHVEQKLGALWNRPCSEQERSGAQANCNTLPALWMEISILFFHSRFSIFSPHTFEIVIECE